MCIMNFALLLPLALGVTVVTQATLNRTMALHYGLAGTVAFNAAVFFFFSFCFYLFVKYNPTIVPEFLQARQSPGSFRWYFWLPGICGFLLVLGLPWSIQNIGPSLSFILLITSQVLLSFAVEYFQSSTPPNSWRMLGALLVLFGSALVVRA